MLKQRLSLQKYIYVPLVLSPPAENQLVSTQQHAPTTPRIPYVQYQREKKQFQPQKKIQICWKQLYAV